MVQIFKPGAKKRPQQATRSEVVVEALDHLGQGIVRQQPVMFVEGGLPGETCQVSLQKQAGQVQFARATKIIKPSSMRQAPFCRYFGQCGGCQTQHIQPQPLQLERQQAIDGLLKKACVQPVSWDAALSAEQQGYRRKARLAIDNQHKGQFRMGFRAASSKAVVEIEQCPVLTPALQDVLTALRELIPRLQGKKHLGHISLLDTNKRQVCIRIVRELNPKDEALLSEWASQQQLDLVLHLGDEYRALRGEVAQYYPVAPGIELQVMPDDFIQVNGAINQLMVAQALNWLQLEKSDHVLDLFCGVGNFSVPLAHQAGAVIGIEGVAEMVVRAEQNALASQCNNARFSCANLDEPDWTYQAGLRQCNKVLLDPARAGAQFAVKGIAALSPSRIVYVSCNPATFARDAGELKKQGFRLEKISLIDMFPGTAHSELMALFVPD